MKTLLAYYLTLFATTMKSANPFGSTKQNPLSELEPNTIANQERVPGHNNATYGPVARSEQAFAVEFLEIAPTPIIADRFFFVYLRGYFSESRRKEQTVVEEALTKAVIHVTGSVVLSDGRREEPQTVTLPFKTMALSAWSHLAIRDSKGVHVDSLPNAGNADVLLDFQIPNMFVQSGTWTFGIDARLGDDNNTCLFAISLTQWLDGGLNS